MSECISEAKSYWADRTPTLNITNELVRDIVGVDAAWEAYIAETVHFTLSLNRKSGQNLQEAKADIGDAFRKEFDDVLCGQDSEVCACQASAFDQLSRRSCSGKVVRMF